MAETQTQAQGDRDVANHRAEIRPQVPTEDEWIPQILLNEGLRLFFLRTVVASSLVTTGFMLYATVALGRYTQSKHTLKWAIPAVLLTVFTTAHHIATAFGPFFPLPVWVDIGLTVLESICCFAAIGYLTFYSNQLGAQWFPSYGLAALVGLWILSFSVVILALLKTINSISARRTSSYQQPVAGGDPKKLAWWKYPARNLFGRRMWGRNVPGESKWLARLRGLIALIAVCALVAFGLFQTIVTPIAELGKIPHRAYRIAGIDYNTAMGRDVRDVQYSVLLLWSRHPGATTNLTSAVAATARWRQGSGPAQLQQRVPCRVQRVGASLLTTVSRETWEVAAALCPRSPNQQDGNPLNDAPWWDFPNFDLSVNYTGLLGSAGAVSSDRVSDTLRVYLGLTGDLERVYVNTEPGLDPMQLGTFGFESYENYLVASVVQTISNPYIAPPSNPNAATLGFALQTAQGGWTVLQDYRSKSVLSGLSALGGLGSLLSTILAVLLGTSLVQAILRSKPNSPFGILHDTDSLQEERAKQYPKLDDDIDKARKEKGILAYLLNTLIDGESENKNTSSTGTEAIAAGGHNHDEESRGSKEGASGKGEQASETGHSTVVAPNEGSGKVQ